MPDTVNVHRPSPSPTQLHGWLVGTPAAVLRTIDGGEHLVGAAGRARRRAAQPSSPSIPMTAWVGTADGQLLATSTGGH